MTSRCAFALARLQRTRLTFRDWAELVDRTARLALQLETGPDAGSSRQGRSAADSGRPDRRRTPRPGCVVLHFGGPEPVRDVRVQPPGAERRCRRAIATSRDDSSETGLGRQPRLVVEPAIGRVAFARGNVLGIATRSRPLGGSRRSPGLCLCLCRRRRLWRDPRRRCSDGRSETEETDHFARRGPDGHHCRRCCRRTTRIPASGCSAVAIACDDRRSAPTPETAPGTLAAASAAPLAAASTSLFSTPSIVLIQDPCFVDFGGCCCCCGPSTSSGRATLARIGATFERERFSFFRRRLGRRVATGCDRSGGRRGRPPRPFKQEEKDRGTRFVKEGGRRRRRCSFKAEADTQRLYG